MSCKGTKKNGQPCSAKANNENGFCGRHQKQAATYVASKSKKGGPRTSTLPVCKGFKSNSKPCQMKTSRPSGFCRYHDPEYDPAEAKTNYVEPKFATFLTRLHANLEERYQMKLELTPTKPNVSESESNQIVQAIVRRTVTESFERDRDIGSYLRGSKGYQPTGFSRKVWILISRALEDDALSYNALALTCHQMHTLLCKDKVWHFRHPFKEVWMTPSLYMLPIFRVVVLPLPDSLDDFFGMHGYPKLADILKQHELEFGAMTSELEREANMAPIIAHVIEEVLGKMMKPEDEIEGCIAGAGFFSDPPLNFSPKFHGKCDCKIVRRGSAMFVILTGGVKNLTKAHINLKYQLVKLTQDHLVDIIAC